VAGVPVADDVLPTTGSSFTVEILVNTPMCYMFSKINRHVLYILVKTSLDIEMQVELFVDQYSNLYVLLTL
jgi:hypothetical protein